MHLSLTAEYHIAEVGGEFLLDAVFALADGAGSGVSDIGNDIVAIAKVGAEAADELLVVEFGVLDERGTSLLECGEQRTLHVACGLEGHIVELLLLYLHRVEVVVAGGVFEGTATIGKAAAQYQ